MRWLEEEGPLVPELLAELERREKEFAYFIFFSYRYYHSFHGVEKFSRKAILVPTAEHDQVIYLSLFKDFFNLPAAIVYNSPEEKELINRVSGQRSGAAGTWSASAPRSPSVSTRRGRWPGSASRGSMSFTSAAWMRTRAYPSCSIFTFGCWPKRQTDLKLLLVGKAYVPIPEHPDIVHVGFQENREKFDLLCGAEFLVMPSQYESLSMVALEAWAVGKPVLANGRTDVLRGQCRRSHAGLWYSDYDEFRETFLALERRPRPAPAAGRQRQGVFPGELFLAGHRGQVSGDHFRPGSKGGRNTGLAALGLQLVFFYLGQQIDPGDAQYLRRLAFCCPWYAEGHF